MKKKYVVHSIALLLIGLNFLACSAASIVQKSSSGIIDADDPNIQYVGRFNLSNPKKVTYDWPGVFITAFFEGTSCTVRLNDSQNEYAVIIDNNAPRLLNTDTSKTYLIANNLNGSRPHKIVIQKRTETFVGKGEFLGFVLDEGKKILPPEKRPDRRIEFIGNSITCAYGVEGDSATCRYSPGTQNANLSYASIIARELNADYSLIAYSGRGVVRNYGDKNKTSVDPMPCLYDRICFNDSTSKWNFTSWIPQVVVINLGTNDFSTKPFPDKDVFQNAYKNLIGKVRSFYPGVMIFCLCGPMIDEPCLSYIKEVVRDEQKDKRDRDVFFIGIHYSVMTKEDWGCDSHPNVKGMLKMVREIAPEIKARMNW
jgi:hypothetical protein